MTSVKPRPRVLLSAALPDDLTRWLRRDCEVTVSSPDELLDAMTIRAFSDFEGWLTRVRQPLGQELLAVLPRLRVVSRVGVGVDNVDVPAATRAGVIVCNTPGVLDAAVAELTIGMVIAVGRQFSAGERFVRSGEWMHRSPPMSHDVHGKTLGVLGLGRIGSRVAGLARALGMGVVYHDPVRKQDAEACGTASYLEWGEFFAESDFISLHLPLTAQTRHLVGEREFALMKPTAYLINCARGAVLDESALVGALRAGTIAGAALDVMETEPLDPTDPLCALDNVLLLPHLGSRTEETRGSMLGLAVRNLQAVVMGRPPEASVNWSLVDQPNNTGG